MSQPTYAALISEGAARLKQAGIEDPRREARLLMGIAARMSSAELIARETDLAAREVTGRFAACIARRAEHVPFAHIAGKVSFFGLDFVCDGRALVPRADSECVIDRALELTDGQVYGHVADLGTGSGCLLGAFLTRRAGWTGVGVEASPEAVSLAFENFRQLDLFDRTDLLAKRWGDWTGWGKTDLILSNPPYIRRDVIPTLDRTVRDYDPRAALDGGADGLDAYRSIIDAAQAMKPGAQIVLEIGFDQAEAVSQLLSAAGFENVETGQDLGGNDRVVSARQPLQ